MATIIGTEDDDDLFVEDVGSSVFGLGGNDRIELFAGEGNFADGGAGNDRFDIRYGWSHVLTGGSGSDVFAPEFMDYTVESTVTDFVAGPGGDVVDLGASIELLSTYNFTRGNPFARRIFVWEQAGADAVLLYDEFWMLANEVGSTFARVLVLENTQILQLGSGNMAGYEPVPVQSYGSQVKGSSAGEELYGSDGADGIQGLGGNDELFGEGGDDIIIDFGGYFAPFSNDRLEGGEGNDSLYDVGGTNALRGGNGNDEITAEFGLNNIIEGNAGNDVILVIESPGARIWGGNGNDSITIQGEDGAWIDAGAGNDTIEGGDGEDVITGGPGVDRITGDVDSISGDGVAHADRFVLLNVADSGPGRKSDFILDFDPGVDSLDLSAIDADAGLSGNQDFVFIGAAAFSAPGQLRALPTGFANQFELLGNVDADLGADVRIVFYGALPLAADIIG